MEYFNDVEMSRNYEVIITSFSFYIIPAIKTTSHKVGKKIIFNFSSICSLNIDCAPSVHVGFNHVFVYQK